jgi:fibronectin type III domain protein
VPRDAVRRTIWLLGLLPLIAACSVPSIPENQLGGTASAEGTLVVNWQAPTRNTDGTPLTDLAGYTIYYGTKPGVYPKTLSIDDPSATRAVINGLQPGVHYFVAISANNAAGSHSVLSSATPAKTRPK